LGVTSVESFGLLFGLVMLELSQLFIDFALQLFEAFCAAPANTKGVLAGLIEFIILLILEPRVNNRRFIFVQAGGGIVVFIHFGHRGLMLGREFVRKLSVETLVETVGFVVVEPFLIAKGLLL
jgi:hypothetical protein